MSANVDTQVGMRTFFDRRYGDECYSTMPKPYPFLSLDRMLVSDGWRDKWETTFQGTLLKNVSDPFHIIQCFSN